MRADIENLLRAIDHAGAVLEAIPSHDAAVYRAGFRAALAAVAVAFDVRLEADELFNSEKLFPVRRVEVQAWPLSLSG